MNLSANSLEWALKNVEAYGDTDIFPEAFEFAAIRHSWTGPTGLLHWLSNQDVLSWTTRPFRRCLTPKHRLGFRVSTQLDPFDTLIYSALVYELGRDIERMRIPKDLGIVHSYRFAPDKKGAMYDPSFGYHSFTDKSVEYVDSGCYDTVVLTDIADFFPRVYSHPLKNAIRDCSKAHPDGANALMGLIGQWNYTISHGIPVGPTASRLLSELAIADVDAALLSERQAFCRYSDDYRLFCSGSREAHERLALLANVLFENQGLTLQPAKTKILTCEQFRERFLSSERATEREALSSRFGEILAELGLDNPYEEIDYDSLEPDLQAKIDALNLKGILEEQLAKNDEMDVPVVRFVLRRLRQLDNETCVALVLDNIESLYPLFKESLEYLRGIRSLVAEQRRAIGGKLLELIDGSIVGHLEYHKCWILNTFTHNTEWDHQEEFVGLINTLPDEFSRREVILALGRARVQHWFKTRKRDVLSFRPWERRAFLAAASCLPGDEVNHWYRSVGPRLDELEKAVVAWATANRFG
jgi:hypothetical protein